MSDTTVSEAPLPVQPQQGIGAYSMPSSSPPSKTLSERWALALGRLQILGALVGWESIRRGMAREDKLAYLDGVAYHELLHGQADETTGTGITDVKDPADEMGDIHMGDKVEHHYHGATPAAPAPLSTLAKAGIAAALISSGAGIGAGVPLLLDALKDAPAIVQPQPQPPDNTHTETIIDRDLRILKPIVE